MVHERIPAREEFLAASASPSFVYSHSRGGGAGGCQLHYIAAEAFCKLFDWQASRCTFYFSDRYVSQGRNLERKAFAFRWSLQNYGHAQSRVLSLVPINIFAVKEYGTNGKLCRDNEADATEVHEIESQIKEEKIFQATTRCRFLPTCVRLAPTHPPLRSQRLLHTRSSPICTHTRRYSHTNGSSTRAATGCRFLPSSSTFLLRDLDVAVSRSLLRLAMDHFIATVLPETETQWPLDTLGESVSTFSLSPLPIWRRCFRSEQFVRGRDRWRQGQLQTRRARALLTWESGRDEPKSQVGRMDRVDAHFLHPEKLNFYAARRSGKDAGDEWKRSQRKKRLHMIPSRDILM